MILSMAVLCLGLTLPGCGTGSATGPPVTGYHAGNLAPDFTLFDLSGADIPYVQAEHDMGLGETDLEKVRIRKVRV